MKRVGILYHPKQEKALPLAEEIEKSLSHQGVSGWLCSAWEEDKPRALAPNSDLLFSIGGDGTILRVARISAPLSIPIVGINLGRLGFMTELNITEIMEKLPDLLAGRGWVEERAMLEVEIPEREKAGGKIFQALNDVVVGRGSSARLVLIETIIDGEFLTIYRADGVIVATATGSTGYSLAAGGPILYPQSREILLQPLASHLSLSQALVLPPEAIIELKVITSHEARLSLDGQVEMPLSSGDRVRVKLSPYVARFLRLRPKTYFYNLLEQKLREKVV